MRRKTKAPHEATFPGAGVGTDATGVPLRPYIASEASNNTAFWCPLGYGECEAANACCYPGRCPRDKPVKFVRTRYVYAGKGEPLRFNPDEDKLDEKAKVHLLNELRGEHPPEVLEHVVDELMEELED